MQPSDCNVKLVINSYNDACPSCNRRFVLGDSIVRLRCMHSTHLECLLKETCLVCLDKRSSPPHQISTSDDEEDTPSRPFQNLPPSIIEKTFFSKKLGLESIRSRYAALSLVGLKDMGLRKEHFAIYRHLLPLDQLARFQGVSQATLESLLHITRRDLLEYGYTSEEIWKLGYYS